MKPHNTNQNLWAGMFAAALLSVCGNAQSADAPATLKKAYQDHFRVGAAVNRSLVTGTTFRRSAEQNAKDVALSAAGGQRGFGADLANNAAVTQGGLVSDADKKLADAYAGIFRAFVKHRNSVKMVTFWGVNDANSWRAQGKPLLFDGNSQPKPAFRCCPRRGKETVKW